MTTKSSKRRALGIPDEYPDATLTLSKNHQDARLWCSITTAGVGFFVAMKTEASIRRIALFAAFVIAAAVLAGVSHSEVMILLVSWASVLTAELMNVSLEKALDYASDKEYHPLIRKGKDYAAASVMIVSAVALAVSAMIFYRELT